jgi:hypothetical protein
MERKTKQPREVDDFDIICTRRLGAGDVITGVTATYAGPDLALAIERCEWTDTVAKVWLSGGTDKKNYKITLLITTAKGRTIESDFILIVKDA